MSLDLGSITAFLTLDTEEFKKNWADAQETAESGAESMEESTSGVEKGLKKIAGLFAGLSIVDFFKSAITAASDLNETVNKSNTIFGANAKAVDQWSDNAAKSMGLSKSAALEAAATFGDMFSQIGFSADEAAKLSTSVVQLSADLGSFNNLETADVADRISAAFRGEYDSLQALIPNINGARVENEALAATGKENAKQLTAQERATAVLAIVTQDGSKAIGDFARTSDSFANTQKTLAAQFEDTQAAIGQGLLPAAQALLGLFQSVGIPVLTTLGSAIGFLVELVMQIPGPIWAAVAAFAGMAIVSQIAGFFYGLAYIIPIIITGMGGLAASATIAGRALALMGGPIVVGLGAVAAAITFLVTNSEDATIAIGELGSAIDENTGKLKANAAEIIAGQTTDAAAKYVELGGKVGDFTAALTGNEAAQKRVNETLRAAGIAALEASGNYQGIITPLNTAGLTAEQAYDNFISLGGSLTNFGDELNSVGGVQDAYNRGLGQLAEASAAAETATAETAGAIETQGGAAAQAAPSVESLQSATKKLSEAADFANAAVQFLTLTLDQVSGKAISNEQATRAFDASIRGIGQSARDVAAALQTQAEKAEASTAATAEFGAGSREATAAQREYDNATAAVSDALDRQFNANIQTQQSALLLATSAYQAAAANGDLGAGAAAATASVEASRAAFIAAQPEADRLSGKANATATALFGIPGQVATSITESGAANVQGQAHGVEQAVDDIPKTSHTTITASVEGGSFNMIEDFKQRVNSVPPRKTTIMETIIQNAQPGFTGGKADLIFPGYAGGGKLPGIPPNPLMDNLWGIGPKGNAIRVQSGEWLIRRQASQYYGDRMMSEINAMVFPKPEGYNMGGKLAVISPPSSTPAPMTMTGNIDGSNYKLIIEFRGDGVLKDFVQENARLVVEDNQSVQGRQIQFGR